MTAGERLQGLPDDRPGAVNGHAAEVERLGAHGGAAAGAGDEKVAHPDR